MTKTNARKIRKRKKNK